MNEWLRDVQQSSTHFDSQAYVQAIRDQVKHEAVHSRQCMLPSFVNVLPDGHETGEFLALDLGGSTFRVAVIRLLGNRQSPLILSSRVWKIEEAAKVTHSDKFFNWLASCVLEVVGKHEQIAVWQCGLAFSFPIEETSVNTGKIMLMGKGYKFTDDIGSVCIKERLDRAFKNAGLNIDIAAIVNDTLATLISHKYVDDRCAVSLVLGTGCNASLHMAASHLPADKLRHGSNVPSLETVLINAEMSMLGKESLPWTRYDRQLDAASSQPGYQPLEQFTSGRYMGEIVRLILLDAHRSRQIFIESSPASLHFPYSFDTGVMSKLAEANDRPGTPIIEILDKTYPKMSGDWSLEEAFFVDRIAQLVSARSARLIAASIHALSSFIDTSPGSLELPVACCGTIIECYPEYRDMCQKALLDLGSNIKLAVAKDSGLLGAAITASVVNKENQASNRPS